jgi:sarcosine oxidase subunit gamma
MSDDRKAGEFAAALRGDAAGGFVSEVTDGLTVFELTGPAVRDLLAMGCSLDLTQAAMAPGRSARTLFAGVKVTLYPHRSNDCFRLHVERPLARYLMDFFDTAVTAFG